ncbi:CapA family protein [Planktothrix pseudagardhii]|uniref:Capsule biosynthesis protein CapA n=1 Tax=Planktothrix pseudagardhii TaxID=132604 RepID=A0A9W4G474_9CYAN|nr:CapA family protein [Planktothrix pseudagardhii]CAD5931626.1 Capsule biosynthesis protein CapA [Planktothrix pseudagardhii]
MNLGLQLRLITFLLTSSFLVLIGGCDRNTTQTKQSEAVAEVTATQPPKPYTKEAELVAVGDIMMHGAQIKSGYNPTTKTYNYDNFFTEVKGILSSGDWIIGNLETTLSGPETGYTGYPLFNAPDPLADAIKKAGFNIISTTNNHSLDRGEKGVLKTLENVKKRGLIPIGTATSAKEAAKITIVEKNNISMAILGYSYGTNGIPIPKGKNYLVSLINPQKITQDITKARQAGVDLVTVILHFGLEYQRQPSAEQKALVKQLVNAGADIILGSHPHVVQPYQIIEKTGKSEKPKKAVVIYSMGNFISNQREKYRDLGVIFKVKVLKKFPDETTEIKEIKAIPTWVHRYSQGGKYQFRVLPIEQVLKTRKHPLLSPSDYQQLETDLKNMNRHLHSFQ